MARVLATGAAPPSRAAMAGGAIGQGLGLTGGVMAANRTNEARAQQGLDPIRQAIEELLVNQGVMQPGALSQVNEAVQTNPLQFALGGPQPAQPPMATPTGQGTNAQQLLARLQQDPSAFARLFAEQGVEGLLGMASGPAGQDQTMVLDGSSPEGRQLGLRPNERARVKGVMSPQGQFVPREVLGTFSSGEGSGGAPAQIVSGDSEQGRALGIPPGEFARVEGQMSPDGQFLPSRVVGRFATSDSGEPSMFGTGLQGRSLEYMTTMSPDFANARTNDEQDRVFLSSVVNYRQPQQWQDPDTGLMQTRRNELPPFVLDALRARGYSLADIDSMSGQMQAPGQGAGTQTGGAQPAQPAQQGAAAPAQEAMTPEQEMAAAQTPTLSPDAVVPDLSDLVSDSRRTLFHEVADGNVTGPVPWLQRGLSRFPGLGFSAREQQEAGRFVDTMNLRVIHTLQQNPRYAVAERSDIIDRLQIDPSVFDSTHTLMDRMVGIDRTLAEIEREMREVIEGKRDRVSGETARHAMDTLVNVEHFREVLMPPRMENVQQATEFVQSNPSGTQFVALDENGRWRIWEVE